ncbi:MAG: hypothetical protein JW723_10000 [Bacteroidales bacterium]|nr:hypothetical protein [Bacteroidales bacterium]
MYQLKRTPGDSYKQLCIIYIFFLLGILLFSGFVLFYIVTRDGGFLTTGLKSYGTVKWIFAIVVLVLLPATAYVHRHKIDNLNLSLSLDNKLLTYRNSFVTKISIISFICFANAFILFLYGQLNMVIPLILFILYFLLNRPYAGRISDELHLSKLEIEELRQ